jgi:hypothetical protein
MVEVKDPDDRHSVVDARMSTNPIGFINNPKNDDFYRWYTHENLFPSDPLMLKTPQYRYPRWELNEDLTADSVVGTERKNLRTEQNRSRADGLLDPFDAESTRLNYQKQPQ